MEDARRNQVQVRLLAAVELGMAGVVAALETGDGAVLLGQ
jgi:hypothetical protein